MSWNDISRAVNAVISGRFGTFIANITFFHRKESPTQTSADALKQIASGEIWGRAHKQNGTFLCVKAYPGQLLAGDRGIDFTTPVAPDPRYSTPHHARWYYPHTDNAQRRTDPGGEEFAAIPANVTNKQP
jgi:hypothetical protein